MTATFIDVDVRPILRAGGEPFAEIMGAINRLKPGEGLRLFATFEPTPLFQVLGSKGFTHKARAIEGGDWEVLFSPPDTPASDVSMSVTQPTDETRWPEPIQQMDNRDLDPPEPMVRILAATEKMMPGEVLAALLCQEPVFLFPELAKRGHSWRGGFEPDGTTYKVLVRVNSGKKQPS
jgi:uncharacterized protein (DUF2249 family)